MFLSIFLFELRYRIKRPATWVYLLLYTAIGVLYGALIYGSFGENATIQITGGGKIYHNAPFVIQALVSALGQIGVFAVAAIMAVPVYRDFEHQTHSIFFTKPISKFAYLGGRFAGSFIVTIVVLSGIVWGMILALLLPNIQSEKLLAFNFYHYWHPFFISVIPFIFFSGAIFFATVSLSRNQLFIYLNAIIILVLLSVAGTLTAEMDNKFLAALLDPTGDITIRNITEYWTVAEKNTQVVPLLWIWTLNKLIWMSVALVIVVFTYFRFSFSFGNTGTLFRPKNVSAFKLISDTVTTKKLFLPKTTQSFGFNNHLKQLWILIKRETKGILLNPIFIAITLMGVLLMILVAATSGQIFETPTLPVTYRILDITTGSFSLFMLAIVVFYSGEMVWAERLHQVNQMYDALPIPNWLSFISKLLALYLAIYFLMFIVLLCGMAIQAFQGYFKFELGLYLQTLFIFRIWALLLFATVAFFIQVIVNNKYFGFFLVVLFFFLNTTILPLLGVEENLVIFNSGGNLPYSDMNAYGHFLYPFLNFRFYWTSLAIILFILASLFWVRGSDLAWKSRIRNVRQNLNPSFRFALFVSILAFFGFGSFIYYNTHILNRYTTPVQQEKIRVDYEKKYKKFEKIPQPKITDIRLFVDLYPENRSMAAKGTYILKNKSKEAIDSIHLITAQNPIAAEFKFNKGFKKVFDNKEMDYYIFKLDKPLEPNESIELNFTLKYANKGFTNSDSNTDLVYNGTFFNNYYFPKIGYQSDFEIIQDDLRKKYKLPKRERVPSIHDKEAIKRNFIANDADWVNYECTLSTSPDQIAVSPGYLQKEWKEKGRRYFHYKMDSPILHFYSILSGRYEVKKAKWKGKNGQAVNIEIFYHQDHTRNLDRMIKSIQKSLDYFTENFGDFQHRQMRILEFPRYASFAQSFPNTVPYSEGIGFIADISDKSDIDYVFYVTAHEVAHQWWAHQVVPGNTQGANTISESMSQYSSLMVMEKEYGAEQMKKFLKQEMDGYLQGRSGEFKGERPLMLTENQQYIHYQKGSVIMYALKDYIGEKALNNALKKYIQKVKFQEPPYTTAKEWVAFMREATPDSLKYLIKDFFETITLYDNQVEKVTYTKKGKKYLVKIKLLAQKFRADELGNEKTIPFADYIDIGIFTRAKVGKDWKEVALYFKKHKITHKTKEIEILVDQEPRNAGIDPYHKLIDRKPDDNMKRVEKMNDLRKN